MIFLFHIPLQLGSQISITSMAEAKVENMPYAIAPSELPLEQTQVSLKY